jgi:hypothetical protein
MNADLERHILKDSLMKSSISARICGNDYACQIHRSDLPFFEAVYGPAMALYRKITSGSWTAADIRDVIAFAFTSREKRDVLPEHFAMRSRLAASMAGEPTVIDRAIAERGIGHYVPLALGILAACLWGVPDEDAVFTDEDPANGQDA